MTRYAELEPAENEYKPLIDPFGLILARILWFLKALEERKYRGYEIYCQS